MIFLKKTEQNENQQISRLKVGDIKEANYNVGNWE